MLLIIPHSLLLAHLHQGREEGEHLTYLKEMEEREARREEEAQQREERRAREVEERDTRQYEETKKREEEARQREEEYRERTQRRQEMRDVERGCSKRGEVPQFNGDVRNSLSRPGPYNGWPGGHCPSAQIG
ncbi:uncharacterized protein LOC131535692 [Onychostoma macrolepis]|uniref:uncharacterized protein LOC131535692 n=1 Tax=Onychostoma macrolepis TaxID=369639 RepID=UPI00272AE583|nr:uncharacterized protein LOC131535692 [Onychostoma macrolepis]